MANGMTRRDVLKKSMIAGSVALGAPATTVAANGCPAGRGLENKWENEYDFGHKILFMEEYFQGTINMLGALSGEIEHIGELTNRAANVVRNGGTVWSSIYIGHMATTEQDEKRPGNPNVLKTHKTMSEKQNKGEMKEADFGGLKPGDMIFTNYCNKSIQEARDGGVYVVSVPVNYINNEFYPEGYVLPNEDNLVLGDVSNDILHSHISYEQGLVHAPEIPYMAICPSSTTGLCSLYWMLSAELAVKLADKKAKDVGPSAEYMKILTERVTMLRSHMDRIRETAVQMTYRIREGGRWFVRSIEHSGLESELVRVASGPWMPNTGDWNANPFKNVMLISGISPAYPEEKKLALEKQVEGAYVIGIGPSSMDGKKAVGNLIDIADSGFDNFSPESGGVISIPGREGTYCPTSGIVGNVIQQMICAQWADEMARRGSIPYFLMGNYRTGRGFNRMMQPYAEMRGY